MITLRIVFYHFGGLNFYLCHISANPFMGAMMTEPLNCHMQVSVFSKNIVSQYNNIDINQNIC